MSDIITDLGLDQLDDVMAFVTSEDGDLYSFVGDYGPTDEKFRRQAHGTLFSHDGDEILVEGDFNGHAIFRRFGVGGYHSLGAITWQRLVDECEPVADNWIDMPD